MHGDEPASPPPQDDATTAEWRSMADRGRSFAGDELDVTALGDAVNVAARLGSAAGAGELVVSAAAWDAATDPTVIERRSIEVKGRTAPLEVVVLTSDQLTRA